jgi:hypothetical protein
LIRELTNGVREAITGNGLQAGENETNEAMSQKSGGGTRLATHHCYLQEPKLTWTPLINTNYCSRLVEEFPQRELLLTEPLLIDPPAYKSQGLPHSVRQPFHQSIKTLSPHFSLQQLQRLNDRTAAPISQGHL